MNTKVYASFQHYDHKGRRLSIFGTPFPDGSGMEIRIITCSKADNFIKWIGWQLYNHSIANPGVMNKICTPEIETVPFTKKHEFLKYCNQRFYKIQYYYASIPGIPIEMDVTGKYGGSLLKKKGGAIIKYLGK